MTILEAELGSPQIIELIASCLIFETTQMLLESEFYNFRYSYKSEKQLDSNSSKKGTVTVQVFVDE